MSTIQQSLCHLILYDMELFYYFGMWIPVKILAVTIRYRLYSVIVTQNCLQALDLNNFVNIDKKIFMKIDKKIVHIFGKLIDAWRQTKQCLQLNRSFSWLANITVFSWLPVERKYKRRFETVWLTPWIAFHLWQRKPSLLRHCLGGWLWLPRRLGVYS